MGFVSLEGCEVYILVSVNLVSIIFCLLYYGLLKFLVIFSDDDVILFEDGNVMLFCYVEVLLGVLLFGWKMMVMVMFFFEVVEDDIFI